MVNPLMPAGVDIVFAIIAIVMVLAVVAGVVLVVRFLLTATKAAQLTIDKHTSDPSRDD